MLIGYTKVQRNRVAVLLRRAQFLTQRLIELDRGRASARNRDRAELGALRWALFVIVDTHGPLDDPGAEDVYRALQRWSPGVPSLGTMRPTSRSCQRMRARRQLPPS